MRIIEAAQRLFTKRGYAAATVESIASEAGVATDTVYGVFGSKRAVLAGLMDIRVGGDDQPIPVLERAEPQAVRRERNQRRQIALFAVGISERIERSRPVDDIMRSAAAVDPEIASLRADLQEQRFRNMTAFVRWLRANGQLRGDRTVDDAATVVWSLTSPEVHRLLRVDRQWSPQQFERWLADTLTRTLIR